MLSFHCKNEGWQHTHIDTRFNIEYNDGIGVIAKCLGRTTRAFSHVPGVTKHVRFLYGADDIMES